MHDRSRPEGPADDAAARATDAATFSVAPPFPMEVGDLSGWKNEPHQAVIY